MDAVADFFFSSLSTLLMSRMPRKTREIAHKLTFDFIFEETLPNATKECLALAKAVASSLLVDTANASANHKAYAKYVEAVKNKLKTARGEEKAVVSRERERER